MPVLVRELRKEGKGYAKFKDFLKDFLLGNKELAFTVQELADEALKLEEWDVKYGVRRKYLEQLIRNYLIDFLRLKIIEKYKGRYFYKK